MRLVTKRETELWIVTVEHAGLGLGAGVRCFLWRVVLGLVAALAHPIRADLCLAAGGGQRWALERAAVRARERIVRDDSRHAHRPAHTKSSSPDWK